MPGPCSRPIGGKTSYVRQHSTQEPANVPKNLARRIAGWQETVKGNTPTEYHKPGSRNK